MFLYNSTVRAVDLVPLSRLPEPPLLTCPGPAPCAGFEGGDCRSEWDLWVCGFDVKYGTVFVLHQLSG